MTAKENALYALMQDTGFSYGACITSLQILSQSREAIDEAIDYIYTKHPTESEFVEFISEICD